MPAWPIFLSDWGQINRSVLIQWPSCRVSNGREATQFIFIDPTEEYLFYMFMIWTRLKVFTRMGNWFCDVLDRVSSSLYYVYDRSEHQLCYSFFLIKIIFFIQRKIYLSSIHNLQHNETTIYRLKLIIHFFILSKQK